MTNRLTRGVEISANVAIIFVAVLLGVVLVRQQLRPDAQTQAAARQPRAAAPAPRPQMMAAGSKLPLSGVNWAGNQRTLVLALSSRCHFCTESAEFYRRLAEARAERSDLRMVAVLPQDVSEGRAYMDKLGLKVDEVRQSSLDAVGVAGTPTLIMVDGEGAATELWVGKLPPDRESEVLGRIRGERASR